MELRVAVDVTYEPASAVLDKVVQTITAQKDVTTAFEVDQGGPIYDDDNKKIGDWEVVR